MARARRVKPDEELTLVEHLDELRSRIIIVLAVLAVIAMLLPGVDPISFIVEFIPLLALYGLSYFIVVAVERGRQEEEPDAAPLT